MLVNLYALSDPRAPHDYRYIGQTTKDPAERLKGHVQVALSKKPDGTWRNAVTHKNAWIRALARDGYKPIVTLLKKCDRADRVFAEQQMIAALREAGYRLTNGTTGGEGPHLYKATDQTRRRQSEANRRRFENNPVERERYRQLLLQRTNTPEGRKALSDQATAQWASPDARKAQSERLKAALADPAVRARRSAAIRKRMLDTETWDELRRAISERVSGEGNRAAKLNWNIVRSIRARITDGTSTRRALATEFGVTRSLIDQIVNCVIWTNDPTGATPSRPDTYKPRAPGLTDERLETVARVYRASVSSGQPSQAVAQHFDISPMLAYSWIATARRRGFLGATKPGVPGETAA